MIVLVLVAVLWLAVLVPTILSKLSERRSAGSIGRFHQRLDLLERTGPKLVQPAYRLTGTEAGSRPGAPLVVPVSPPPVRPTLSLVSDSEHSGGVDPADETGAIMDDDEFAALQFANLGEGHSRTHADEHLMVGRHDRGGRVATNRKRLARRRRRDIFAGLCALAAVTGLIGVAHPLRGAWVASAVFVALLIGFVGLAAYGQHLEGERRHLDRLASREDSIEPHPEPTSIVRYLSEDELDLYYENLPEDGTEDHRLVAEG